MEMGAGPDLRDSGGPPVLPRTTQLRLREFVPDDWTTVLGWYGDPRFSRFVSEEQASEGEVRRLVERFVEWREERPRSRRQWAVVLPGDDRPIGSCGIRRPDPGAREAEIGFELAAEHWGRGYATELAALLLRFGFLELGLHRVTSYCLAENVASARVLEKVGMRPEGRLRENEWFAGRWWDTLLFGILEAEWRASLRSDPEAG
jgi:ribosomal-protein-alanine N-acetyltransferase